MAALPKDSGQTGTSNRTDHESEPNRNSFSFRPTAIASPAEKLICRLDQAEQLGNGRWLACCPAHDDRKPSLSIRETADGILLIKCWSGCSAAEILDAVGLRLKDLFPQNKADQSPLCVHQRFPAVDVLAAIDHELLIVAQAAHIIAERSLTDEERDRLSLASSRIHAAAREVHRGKR